MSSSTSGLPPEQIKRKARRTLLIILGVCIAPFIAAVIAFNFFPPTEQVNYGELLEPKAVPNDALLSEGKAFSLNELRGKWILLQLDSGQCDRACETKLFNMRQSRVAQGREMDRIERVWIRLDDQKPDPKLAPLYQDVHMLAGASPQFIAAFPATAGAQSHIYVIDPLGNLMMRYPPDADPKKIAKDLGRLLKVSRVG